MLWNDVDGREAAQRFRETALGRLTDRIGSRAVIALRPTLFVVA
jgi:hypothetical protein